MKIAIWTTKKPKVDWVKEAISTCPYFKWLEIEFILEKVKSGVSDMPLSMEETMNWAKNRALNMKNNWIKADFYVWLEWWTWDFLWIKYLWWVTCVLDKTWEFHFWVSNCIEVPNIISKKLYQDKLELWPIMSELSWITNIQSKNWAMWAWSDDMLVRKKQFISWFQMAISPFFNKYYKLKND